MHEGGLKVRAWRIGSIEAALIHNKAPGAPAISVGIVRPRAGSEASRATEADIARMHGGGNGASWGGGEVHTL